ncbi:MAG: hypothetical protein Q4F43_03565, partial [Eubacteriales bacterium]|nr:hypothetical protein [Eubacteriales bacterium]
MNLEEAATARTELPEEATAFPETGATADPALSENTARSAESAAAAETGAAETGENAEKAFQGETENGGNAAYEKDNTGNSDISEEREKAGNSDISEEREYAGSAAASEETEKGQPEQDHAAADPPSEEDRSGAGNSTGKTLSKDGKTASEGETLTAPAPDPSIGKTGEGDEVPAGDTENQGPEIIISAGGGKKAETGEGTLYCYSRKTWEDESIMIKDQDQIKSVTVTGENRNSGAKKTWEYREDEAAEGGITVNEEKTSVLIQIDSASVLGDGRIRFTVYAEDGKGNSTSTFQADENRCAVLVKNDPSGKSTAEICFDNQPPVIEVRMKGGRLYDGNWLYRSDNCRLGIQITDEICPLDTVQAVLHEEDGEQEIKVDMHREISGRGILTYSLGAAITETRDEDIFNSINISVPPEKIIALKDGRISLSVRTRDSAGNETGLFSAAGGEGDFFLFKEGQCVSESGKTGEEAVFFLDTKAPLVTAEMTGAGKRYASDVWPDYYRADNCGIQIRIEGEPLYTYRIHIRNTDNGKNLEQTMERDGDTGKTSCTRSIPGEGKKSMEISSGDHTEIAFSEREVCALGDGRIQITVDAEDPAGNRILDWENGKGMKTWKNSEGREEGRFNLDLTCPVVTSIYTNAAGRGDENTKNGLVKPYEDGKQGGFFYYNQPQLQTVFTIEEHNPVRWDISCHLNGQVTGEEDSWEEDSKADEGTAQGRQQVTFHYCSGQKEKGESAEGRYTGIRISGTDKAGNPLRLQRDSSGKIVSRYTGEGKSEEDQAVEETDRSGAGVVQLLCGKVLDRTPPVADLTYTTDAEVWFYDAADPADGDPDTDEADYRIGTAYVNRGFTAALHITDRCGAEKGGEEIPLDGDRLVFIQYRGGKEERKAGEKALQKDGSFQWTFKVTEESGGRMDGGYYYKVLGTDRAGNAACMREQIRADLKSEKAVSKFCETKNCHQSCPAGFRFVLDTVSPTFVFSMADPRGLETTDGTKAYYGSTTKQMRASFTVEEKNLDQDRILTGYAFFPAKNTSHYDQVRFTWKNVMLQGGGFRRKGQRYSLSLQSDKEGVYRFAIQGTDKAGNPVIQGKEERTAAGFRGTVKAGEGCYWSRQKILDRTAPTGLLEIGNGRQNYYHLELGREGNNTLAEGENRYAPYRRERSASIQISTKDRSPIRVTWQIDSTVQGKAQKHMDADYSNDNFKSASVEGEQIFCVRDLVLVDRAGNRSGLIRENAREANRIYLDVTPPVNEDIDRPFAAITADGNVTRSSADGRDLFNHAVDLKIRVMDPNENVKSAGLARVTYNVRADGRTVISRTISGTQGIDGRKFHTGRPPLYGEQELDHLFEKTIHLDTGGVFETNAIEVEVTAEDNAGNQAPKVTYKCGIDTQGPAITVRYDNNSVRNGFYFNADRHAVIEVLDRNVDDSKIRIRTQAKSKGSFQNTRHSGNGSEDRWERTITYAEDGVYTLEVTGTDALGNKASVQYTGEATQHFVVDKTPPILHIVFDVEEGYQGSRFFPTSRTGTVEITEKNFRTEDAVVHSGGMLRSPEGTVEVYPEAGDWHSSGDLHTRPYRFMKDGDYTLSAQCADLAGNQAEQSVAEPFTVDRTKPVIYIENQSVRPGDLYTGVIAPRIHYGDNNYDPAGVTFRLEGMKGAAGRGLKRKELTDDGTGFGGAVIFEDFPSRRLYDDIYTASGRITDRAGNRAELTFSFSVNRFGSTFDYNEDAVTRSFVHSCRQQGRDLYLREINVNELVSKEIYLSHDADFIKLTEGRDYTVEHVQGAGAFSGNVYLYRIKADCFEKEGHYEV